MDQHEPADRATATAMFPFVGFFTLVYLGVQAVILVIALKWAIPHGLHIGIAPPLLASNFTHHRFLRRHRRLLTREEFWQMTMWAFLVDSIVQLAPIPLLFSPSQIGDPYVLAVIAISLAGHLALLAIGFGVGAKRFLANLEAKSAAQ